MKERNQTDPSGTSNTPPVSPSRRNFLFQSLASAGVAAVIPAATSEATTAPRRRPEALVNGNPLERMRAELQRALEKPADQHKWIMVIDLARCIGCRACTISCNAENNLPPGVVYRPVPEEELGDFPNVRKRFTPRPCMHCDKPPCVPVCPVKATYKRPDGIVAVDYDVCIGCRYCLTACPYSARTADFGEYFTDCGAGNSPAMVGQEASAYETRANFEYGKAWERPKASHGSPKGNARKCQFCLHRVYNGLLPGCVTTCLGGATLFGDHQDETSLVHELVGQERMVRLMEELGTEPSVFYLM